MTRCAAVATAEPILHAALEPSKNSWLLAIEFPGRDAPSRYPLRGGDAEGLMAKLDAARDRVAKVTGRTPTVTPCHEAGYDGFWLARLLEHRGVECLVMEPDSLRVNRRARRVKTDRIDVGQILHPAIASTTSDSRASALPHRASSSVARTCSWVAIATPDSR